MIGLVRLSPVLIRPLARRPQTLKLVIKHKSRFSTYTSGASIFPFGPYSSLIKPALFTVGVIGGSFCLAEYAVKKRYTWRGITESIKAALNSYSWVKPHSGTALMLIGANVAVFIAMQMPVAMHLVHRYFTHSITNRRVSTFILSCFGHSGLLHIALNMYMLYTFFPPIQRAIGPERTLALYFSAGAFASFASHVSAIPSLGASGAICGLFASFCMLYPTAQLQMIILPIFALEAQYMLLVPVVIETALLIFLRNRARIDFAAHLGGFAFGAAYVWFLKQYASRTGRLER